MEDLRDKDANRNNDKSGDDGSIEIEVDESGNLEEADLPVIRDKDNEDTVTISKEELKQALEIVGKYEAEREQILRQIIPHLEWEKSKHRSKISELDAQIKLLQKVYGIEDLEINTTKRKTLNAEERAELRERVKETEKLLKERVKGQDHALPLFVTALKRAVTGMSDPERPIASFILSGGTGNGKTLTAKTLAEGLSAESADGIQFKFMKIDCSEFSNGHEGARLTGAPPGYIGFDAGAQLEALEKHPFHVVLFDEIEKGSQQLHNLLLQIMEDGVATLGDGRQVSFKNAIVIMTTNVGAAELTEKRKRPIGFDNGVQQSFELDQIEKITTEALSKRFAPEFLNRIDHKIPYRDLTPEVMFEIATNEVKYVLERAKENNGIDVAVSAEVIEYLADKGYSPAHGARELRRLVEKEIADSLADMLFDMSPEEVADSTFRVKMVDGFPTVVTDKKTIPLQRRSNPPDGGPLLEGRYSAAAGE
ncbi:MAG: ATP-dependent Clp protease ATP-binding subunit [Candidatus Dadabacteria bacterium]|nr:MAG: ATP-dependent Clp protease ATP-binding subunit [Candidatus Dadabacteria bacterium]